MRTRMYEKVKETLENMPEVRIGEVFTEESPLSYVNSITWICIEEKTGKLEKILDTKKKIDEEENFLNQIGIKLAESHKKIKPYYKDFDTIMYKEDIGKKISYFNKKFKINKMYNQIGLHYGQKIGELTEIDQFYTIETNPQDLKKIYKTQFKSLYSKLNDSEDIFDITDLIKKNEGLIDFLTKRELQRTTELFAKRITRLLSE